MSAEQAHLFFQVVARRYERRSMMPDVEPRVWQLGRRVRRRFCADRRNIKAHTVHAAAALAISDVLGCCNHVVNGVLLVVHTLQMYA